MMNEQQIPCCACVPRDNKCGERNRACAAVKRATELLARLIRIGSVTEPAPLVIPLTVHMP